MPSGVGSGCSDRLGRPDQFIYLSVRYCVPEPKTGRLRDGGLQASRGPPGVMPNHFGVLGLVLGEGDIAMLGEYSLILAATAGTSAGPSGTFEGRVGQQVGVGVAFRTAEFGIGAAIPIGKAWSRKHQYGPARAVLVEPVARANFGR